MSSLLELSKDLASLSAVELHELVSSSASATQGCNDLLDLSRLLLSRRELEIRIRSLSATELQNLRAGKASKQLRKLALAGSEVFEEAATLARELDPIPFKATLPHGNSLSAYETMLCVTELLFACERHWLGVIRAGIRSQDAKEIALKLKVTPKEVQQRFQLAMRAGLVAEQHERWVATEAGLSWLELDRLLLACACDSALEAPKPQAKSRRSDRPAAGRISASGFGKPRAIGIWGVSRADGWCSCIASADQLRSSSSSQGSHQRIAKIRGALDCSGRSEHHLPWTAIAEPAQAA